MIAVIRGCLATGSGGRCKPMKSVIGSVVSGRVVICRLNRMDPEREASVLLQILLLSLV